MGHPGAHHGGEVKTLTGQGHLQEESDGDGDCKKYKCDQLGHPATVSNIGMF